MLAMSSRGYPALYGRDEAPLGALLIPDVYKIAEPAAENLRAGLPGGQRVHREAGRLSSAFPCDVEQALVQGPGPVFLVQLRQHVGGAGHDGHGCAPPIGRIGGAEPGAYPQRLQIIGACGLQAQHRLGYDQSQVVLHAIFQPPLPVLPLVTGSGRRVDPYLAVRHVHRKRAHVVGKWVEGAAAGQLKPGVVPVAGEDSIPDAAPFQGKAHVGTTVVHRVDLPVVEEDGDGVSPTGYHGAAPLLNLGQSPCVDVSNRRSVHDFASFPSRAILPGLHPRVFQLSSVILTAVGIQSPSSHPTWCRYAGLVLVGRVPVKPERPGWHNRLGA